MKKCFMAVLLILAVLSPLLAEDTAAEDSGEKRVQWAIVPGPFYNPNVGTGVMIIPMAVYQFDPDDEISPPSSTTGGLLWTKPDWSKRGATWVGGLSQQLFINEDTWRLSGFLGGGTVLYRFYQEGNEAGEDNFYAWIRQDGVYGNVQGLRKVYRKLYGGGFYTFQAYTMYGEEEADQGFLDYLGITQDWQFASILGGKILWDGKDNQYSPTSGIYGDFTVDYGASWLGGDTDYAAFSAIYSQYYALDRNDRHILAWQARGRTTVGDVPPNEMSAVGSDRSGFRGYMNGEYKGKSVIEGQLEVRSFFNDRIGMAAFIGVGGTFPSLGEIGESVWLPAGGVGLRLAMIPEERINARLDFAWGIDSFALYFSVGEAF